MILETVKREVDIPIMFKCDICGKVVKLENEYDIKYNSKVEKIMATIKYEVPTGGYCESAEKIEKHCCSATCVRKAISSIPYGGKITIPNSKYFDNENKSCYF